MKPQLATPPLRGGGRVRARSPGGSRTIRRRRSEAAFGTPLAS